MTSIHDAATDTANMKAKIEQNISTLRDEIEGLERDVTSIRQQKGECQAKKAAEYRKLFELRLKVAELKSKMSVNGEYVQRVSKLIKAIENRINNQMKLVDFEQQMNAAREKIEGAIHFYSDENLHMELMKRNNSAREQRVEYTKVEQQFNILKKRIDDRKMEIERAKRAEEDRRRQVICPPISKPLVKPVPTESTFSLHKTESTFSLHKTEPTFSQLFEW